MLLRAVSIVPFCIAILRVASQTAHVAEVVPLPLIGVCTKFLSVER